jgi:flagellar protein FliJ
MTALQPLIALLEQTERERDDARMQLLRTNAAHAAAQAQADQLLAYRADYEARWGAQFSREGKIEVLRCYQGFVSRLTQAVEHQAKVAAQAARQVEAAQATLRERELRVASVRKLIEGRMHELKRTADRNEQKQIDEFASRAAWGRLAGAPLRAT